MNIEELARRAGFDGFVITARDDYDDREACDYYREQLTAFARLVAEECAKVCAGIGAGHAAATRRQDGRVATHAAGQRDGANECATAIREAFR